MAQKHYLVTGMSCVHCAASITEEVSQVPGVTDVDVDVAAGSVSVGVHNSTTRGCARRSWRRGTRSRNRPRPDGPRSAHGRRVLCGPGGPERIDFVRQQVSENPDRGRRGSVNADPTPPG